MIKFNYGRRIEGVGLLHWRCRIGVFVLHKEYGCNLYILISSEWWVPSSILLSVFVSSYKISKTWRRLYFYISGCWCLPHLSALFPQTKVTTREFGTGQELVASEKQLFLKGEMFGKEDNFESITEKLHSRINNLEDRTIKQSVRLFVDI